MSEAKWRATSMQEGYQAIAPDGKRYNYAAELVPILNALEVRMECPACRALHHLHVAPEEKPRPHYNEQERRITNCQAGGDGDCKWSACPQLRDGEPAASGRHCPLDEEKP